MTVLIVLLIATIILWQALKGVAAITGLIVGFINLFTNDNE